MTFDGAGLTRSLAWVVGGVIRWSSAWSVVGVYVSLFLSMWSSVSR